MKFLSYFTTVLGLSVFVALIFALFQTNVSSRITSPLPDFLSMVHNQQVRFLDLWLPQIEKTEGSMIVPETTGRAVLMYELGTNSTLFEKNARENVPMASLTKIMTAIIALENRRDPDRYTARKEHLVGEGSMGIVAGDTFTLEELLYGLMLHSGNDAAEVIAAHFPTGRTGFIQAMNNKAKAFGLSDTNFTNPSGLQGDGEQYSTAYDLLVMTRYAIEHFPELVTITSTYQKTIPANDSHMEYFLTNETNLLTTYPGVKGFKTGYTPEAGMCLVTYLEYKDHRIVGILLNSEDRREEMKQLLDYSLKTLGETPPEHQ